MITVYTRPACVQCNATKRKLTAEGLDWTAVDLSQDEETADRLREAGHMQAPVVETPEGETWSGFRPDLIAQYADRQRAAQ